MAKVTRYEPWCDGLIAVMLNEVEAEAISVALANVGGPPSGSPREHTQAVLNGLRNVGIKHEKTVAHGLLDGRSSAIIFNSYPKPFVPSFYQRDDLPTRVEWFAAPPTLHLWQPVVVTPREE